MPVHPRGLPAGRLVGLGLDIRHLAKRLADLFGGVGPGEAVFVT